jgi:hypothetical protein
MNRLFHRSKPTPQPVETTVKTLDTSFLQQCASCDVVGATHVLPKSSYFGYVSLSYVRVCDACYITFLRGRTQHYEAMRKKPAPIRLVPLHQQGA